MGARCVGGAVSLAFVLGLAACNVTCEGAPAQTPHKDPSEQVDAHDREGQERAWSTSWKAAPTGPPSGPAAIVPVGGTEVVPIAGVQATLDDPQDAAPCFSPNPHGCDDDASASTDASARSHKSAPARLAPLSPLPPKNATP